MFEELNTNLKAIDAEVSKFKSAVEHINESKGSGATSS